MGRVSKTVWPGYLVAFGGMVNGLLLLGIFNFQSLAAALVLFLAAGLPVVAFAVSINTLLSRKRYAVLQLRKSLARYES